MGNHGIWRTVKRNGQKILVSHNGETFTGTAADVNRAKLSPWARKSLSNVLRVLSRNYDKNFVRGIRRDFIESNMLLTESLIKINGYLRVRAEAAARYMGRTFDEFVIECFESFIEASNGEAKSDGLKDGIPFTRRELEYIASLDGKR